MLTLKFFDAVCKTVVISLVSINLQISLRMFKLICYIITLNFILIS